MRLKAYGPGIRGKDHAALEVSRDKVMVTSIGVYAGKGLPIYVEKSWTREFDTWYAPTPEVPVKRLAELILAHARVMGATAEALKILGEIIPLNEQEIIKMDNLATAALNDKEKAPAKAKAARAPKDGLQKAAKAGKVAAAKTEKAPKAAKAPKAPKAAKAGKVAAAPKEKVEKVVTFKKFPKAGEKFPPQAVAFLQLLKDNGGSLPLNILLEKAQDVVKTKQPIERIWAFYQNKLQSFGFATVK